MLVSLHSSFLSFGKSVKWNLLFCKIHHMLRKPWCWLSMLLFNTTHHSIKMSFKLQYLIILFDHFNTVKRDEFSPIPILAETIMKGCFITSLVLKNCLSILWVNSHLDIYFDKLNVIFHLQESPVHPMLLGEKNWCIKEVTVILRDKYNFFPCFIPE